LSPFFVLPVSIPLCFLPSVFARCGFYLNFEGKMTSSDASRKGSERIDPTHGVIVFIFMGKQKM